jgi:glycosyltransferase involved in cell wall biosynthesis
MVNISFAITVCNEDKELDRLLNQLKTCVIEGDEVVIQVDNSNTNEEVFKIISNFEGVYSPITSRKKDKIVSVTKIFSNLNGDFASFKNGIKKRCTKGWIFFIDADEEVNQDQIHLIREIIELNQDKVEVMLVPRVNIVEGLTQQHINKWRWNVNEKNWINWPDYQFRICKNIPEIQWKNKVHEVLTGYKSLAPLPDAEVVALRHIKTIEKQEKQNSLYDNIQ